MQEIGMVARFKSTPMKSHLLVVKRILSYLKSTPDSGLWYPKNTTIVVKNYIDVDWDGSVDDKKKYQRKHILHGRVSSILA